MQRVALDEIIGFDRYEQVRTEFRRRIIDLKKRRRVAVGDRVTFVFENHDTVLFQIQEMLRAERIADLDRVREEMAVYNALIPNRGELSATMLIEITDAEHIREQLVRLIGIDQAVRFEVGGRYTVRGEFEAGRSQADKLSAVQYVRFAFEPEACRAFRSAAQPPRLVIDHANYRHAAVIDGLVRQSLAGDLEAP